MICNVIREKLTGSNTFLLPSFRSTISKPDIFCLGYHLKAMMKSFKPNPSSGATVNLDRESLSVSFTFISRLKFCIPIAIPNKKAVSEFLVSKKYLVSPCQKFDNRTFKFLKIGVIFTAVVFRQALSK